MGVGKNRRRGEGSGRGRGGGGGGCGGGGGGVGGGRRRRRSEALDWFSAGQGHRVDNLLQFAPQSLSPGLLIPLQGRQDLQAGGEEQEVSKHMHITVPALTGKWTKHGMEKWSSA